MNQLHCGYYSYNGKKYISRRHLLDDMLLVGDNSQVIYHFNDEVFDNIDWTREPTQDLKTLYKERAQQLRDSYEYIILSYSGGADSHEILKIFMENKIFIDEVQVVHQYKLTKNIDKAQLHAETSLSMWLEFEKVAAPAISALSKVSPNTKITLLDASDFIVDDITSMKYSYLGLDKFDTNATFLVSTTPFARNYFQHQHNSKYLNQGKKTCFLRGADKPNIKMFSNFLTFSFTDVTLHGVNLLSNRGMNEVYTIENFFWSPDAPLIPVKQSHVLKYALETDIAFYANFMLSQQQTFRHVEKKMSGFPHVVDFQRQYIKYIYSYYKDIKFAAPKRTSISPEFRSVEILLNQSSFTDALNEQNNFYTTKYKNIENKALLNRTIATKHYNIGEINALWRS